MKYLLQMLGPISLGLIGAQLVTFSGMIVLTRIFSPDEFALFALFTSLVGILSPLVNFRLDNAGLVCTDAEERAHIFITGILISGIFCGLVFIGLSLILSIFGLDYFEGIGLPFLLLPLALLATSNVAIYRAHLYAEKLYIKIAPLPIVQASVTFSVSVVLGLTQIGYSALIIGSFFGLISPIFLYKGTFLRLLSIAKIKAKKQYFLIVKKYKSFPLYNSLPSLVDNLTLYLPFFFLLTFYSAEIAGLYAVTQRIFMAPLSAIAQPLTELNMRKIAEIRENKLLMYKTLLLHLSIFAVFCIVFSLFIVFSIDHLVALLLGDDWLNVGSLITVLLPALCLKSAVSMLSGTLTAVGRDDISALWQVSSLFFVAIVLSLGSFQLKVDGFIELIVIIDLILYSIYAAMIFYGVSHKGQEF